MIIAANIIAISLVIIYFRIRLNAQDKYLSTYIRAVHRQVGQSEQDNFVPPNLDTTEILLEKKQEVYSPRYDIDSQMSGKVIDPFD